MKKKKKLIIGILAAVLAAVVGIGAFFLLRGKGGEKVKVYSVGEYLNNADWFGEEQEEQTGVVSSDYIDEVRLQAGMEVEKIYVKKGDKVKKGQKLLKYNAEEDELNLKLEELQIQSAESKIKKMEEQIERLKKGDSKVLDEGDSIDTDQIKKNNKNNDDDEEGSSGARNPFHMIADSFSINASAAEKSTAAILVAANTKAADSGKTADTEKVTDSAKAADAKNAKASDDGQNQIAKPTLVQQTLVYDGKDHVFVNPDPEERYTVTAGNAVNAGNYKATVTLKEGYVWDDNTTDPLELSYSITKALVEIPAANVLSAYNGKQQQAIPEGDQYTVENNVQINAGKYDAILKLKDGNNYSWARNGQPVDGGSDASVIISYEIPKAGILTAAYEDAKIVEGEKIPTRLIITGFVDGETETNAQRFEMPIVDTSSVSGPGTYSLVPSMGKAENYSEIRYEAGTLIVSNKPAENIFTLAKYNKAKSGKSSKEKPFVINIMSDDEAGDAKIKGEVINKILSQKEYVIFQEWTAKGAGKIFVITPQLGTRKEVEDSAVYTVSSLIKDVLKSGKISIRARTSGADKSVKRGKNYSYQAYLGGANVTSFASWKLKDNTAKTTSLSGSGRLSVASTEKAKRLTITASFLGTSDSVHPKIAVTSTKAKKTTSKKSSTKKATKKTTKKSQKKTSKKSDNDDDDGGSSDPSYTKDEINQAIAEREADLSEAKTDLAQLKIDYKEHKTTVNKALVKAKISGTVTEACTLTTLPEEGEPAITVKASDGMYVKTTVNEMNLDNVKVGGTLNCRSMESEEQIQAVVTEISDYPVGTGSSDGTTNPNSSRYPVVAYIEHAENLHNGDSVYITYNDKMMGTVSDDTVYINKAYVLNEGKQYYVYKRDNNKRLVRQDVQIGDTAYGEYMQIISGITIDDYIAFPYGKNVRDGAKTKISENADEIVY